LPELPEVETTRRRIAPLLVGRTIDAVHTTAPSYFFLTQPAALRRVLEGRGVRELERRGKYLLAHLDDDSRLLLHLGMTGQLFSGTATSPRLLRVSERGILAPEAQQQFKPDEHTHLRLRFRDAGPEIFFRDARKFGKVLWIAKGDSSERIDRLGADALETTGAMLFEASRGRSVAVKNLLLDQSVLAGVGNIYADEALFGSRVRPTRRAGRVTRDEYARIATELRRVLLRSIETGGSSISDYVAPDGADGAYQDERRVYAREGEACSDCGARIKRIVLGQRSAHYCPDCQR
jgi:formamidopyrimidine-DNA glycosylase